MKKILGLILAVGLMLGALPARAEYPDKAITCIVPFAPGGAADITVRMVADYLSKEIGQPLVIVNKGGGSGIPAYRRLRRRGLRPILPSAPASKKEQPFSSLFPAPLTPAALR